MLQVSTGLNKITLSMNLILKKCTVPLVYTIVQSENNNNTAQPTYPVQIK